MVTDIVITLILIGTSIIGYRNGFLRTILKFLFYIVGGVLGIYFALKLSHNWELDIKRVAFVIVAIVGGGFIGSFIGAAVAKSLRATVVRGPLAILDSLAGVALEMIRTVIALYLIATVLLWSPWERVQSQVANSQILAKVQPYLPILISEANEWVKEEFLNLRL